MPTRSHALRLALIATLAAGVGAGTAALAPPYWAAARVLTGTLDVGAGGLLARQAYPVSEREETLAGLRARRYAPLGAGRTPHALLVPGAHPLGIDEPRLGRMARSLAGEGLIVHAAELPLLRALRLGPDTVPQLARLAVATSAQAGGEPVTAFGISVTGGFLLQAALDPRAARALAAVVAVGAHHDLRAVAHAYAERAGSKGPGALDAYGARVLVAAFADALLPAEDVEPARQAIELYVTERYRDARTALGRLSPEAHALIAPLLHEPRAVVPGLMTTLVSRRGDALAALSPVGKLHALRVPAFLLHGEADPIVPSSETRALAAELARAKPPPEVLITPLLRHAEGSQAPTAHQALTLIRFMASVLDSARHPSLAHGQDLP